MGFKPVVDSLCDICGNSVVHRIYGMMEKAFGVALIITLLLILTIGDRY